MITLIVIVGVALVLIVSIVGIYNRLVTRRNHFKNAYAQIDVQLKRRYDLIPNLVETAKGYLKHEKETLTAVIQARDGAAEAAQQASAQPGEPGAMQGLAKAEGLLTGSLGRLFALSEQYPELEANQNMLDLQEELRSTENRIAFARQAFNDSVTAYNTACDKFPDNVVAGAFNFESAELLASTESAEERKTPTVSF